MTGFLVSFTAAGERTWIQVDDETTLKTFAVSPTMQPDENEVHVVAAPSRDGVRVLGTGVHTTLDAIAAWNGQGLPPGVEGTRLATAEARGGLRSTFLGKLKALLRGAVSQDLLDQHQAAALIRATVLALFGVGPAGRRASRQGTAILGQSPSGMADEA